MGLPVARSEFDDFNQITFLELSNLINQIYPNIKIFNENTSDDAYMIKYDDNGYFNGTSDSFEIHIGQIDEHERTSALLHELAHVFFHRCQIPYNTPIGSGMGTWKQETEANYFSRAFLMPEQVFRKALSIFSRNDGTVDLDGIADWFNVSKKVIVSRGNDLKIW